MKIALAACIGVCFAVVSIGCGGGGNTTAGGSGRLQSFASDDFRDDHKQIWATIYKVELLGPAGAVTVFTDSVGKSMDLLLLHDNAGPKFAFLSDIALSVGTYNQVRITMAPDITRFPTGSTTAITTPFAASIPRDSAGNAVFTTTLETPTVITAGATSKLVIDFDLPNFVLTGGVVTPKVKRGDDAMIGDPLRHHEEDYHGTVTNLTGSGSNQTFELKSGSLKTTVIVDASTVLYYEKNQSSPALATNQRVEVNGVFDSVSSTLKATSIKIEDSTGAGNNESGRGIPEVLGVVSAPNAGTRSFTISVLDADDFTPTSSSITVVVTDTTVFRAHRGVLLTESEYFAQLGATSITEVKGTYNSVTQTLTATLVKSESESEGSVDFDEAEVKGRATDINEVAGTFTMGSISEYEGFIPEGVTVAISVLTSARYEDDRGKDTSRAAFFAGLSTAQRVSVQGSYANGKMTGTRLRLK